MPKKTRQTSRKKAARAPRPRPQMSVCFWGVRGSIPTANRHTQRYGGNTPCVEVRCGDELIILDAGSGIRELGNALAGQTNLQASILFSHLHWDHLQGLPFFVPAYKPGNQIRLYAQSRNGMSLEQALHGQMSYPYFPITMREMACSFQFQHFESGQSFTVGEVQITTYPTRHPQNGVAYRIDYRGHSLLYATDTEHLDDGELDPNLLAGARNVDCLIYDTTYTDQEYAGGPKTGMSKKGWGHSTWNEGVKLAKAAGAKRLILFHHDPTRTDRDLAAIERKAKAAFRGALAAREGLTLRF